MWEYNILDIIFIAINLNDNQEKLTLKKIKKYKSMLIEITKRLSTIPYKLDLSFLDNIIIPQNFKEEVYKYRKEHNSSQNITDNKISEGEYAQAITYYINNQIHHTLFISKILVAFLLDDDILNYIKNDDYRNKLISARDIAINTFHHELIHVHDRNTLGNFYNKISSEFEPNTSKTILTESAMGIWTEYFACRESSCTYTKIKDDIEDLYKHVKYFEDIIKCQHKSEIQKISSLCNTLYIYMAYLAGNISGSRNEDYIFQNKQEIFYGLRETIFSDIWLMLFNNLEKLYKLYPNFNDKYIFNDIEQSFLLFYNSIGIVL